MQQAESPKGLGIISNGVALKTKFPGSHGQLHGENKGQASLFL